MSQRSADSETRQVLIVCLAAEISKECLQTAKVRPGTVYEQAATCCPTPPHVLEPQSVTEQNGILADSPNVAVPICLVRV